MKSRKLNIKTVNTLASIIEQGISVNYIVKATGLSWASVENMGANNVKLNSTCKALEKFADDKSYHIAKNNIKKAFRVNNRASVLELSNDGWDLLDINKIKRNA